MGGSGTIDRKRLLIRPRPFMYGVRGRSALIPKAPNVGLATGRTFELKATGTNDLIWIGLSRYVDRYSRPRTPPWPRCEERIIVSSGIVVFILGIRRSVLTKLGLVRAKIQMVVHRLHCLVPTRRIRFPRLHEAVHSGHHTILFAGRREESRFAVLLPKLPASHCESVCHGVGVLPRSRRSGAGRPATTQAP